MPANPKPSTRRSRRGKGASGQPGRERASLFERAVSPALFRKLVRRARAAAGSSYSPYSRFPVGAAVLTADGRVFSGSNVENASYGLSICAERNALFQAVAGGSRRVRVVVVWVPSGRPVSPCGACRQVLHEFGPTAVIVSVSPSGYRATWRMEELLPKPFGPARLTGPARRR